MQFTSLDYTTEELSGSEDGSHIFEVLSFYIFSIGYIFVKAEVAVCF